MSLVVESRYQIPELEARVSLNFAAEVAGIANRKKTRRQVRIRVGVVSDNFEEFCLAGVDRTVLRARGFSSDRSIRIHRSRWSVCLVRTRPPVLDTRKVLKLSAFRLRQLELKVNFNNIEGDERVCSNALPPFL